MLERRRREVEERLGGGATAASRTQRGGGVGERDVYGEEDEEQVRRESGEVLLGNARYQPGVGGGGMI